MSASEPIVERGRVTRVEPHCVWVEPLPRSGCESCDVAGASGGAGGCGKSFDFRSLFGALVGDTAKAVCVPIEQSTQVNGADAESGAFAVGEHVQLVSTTQSVRAAMYLGYLVPLVFALLGAGLLQPLGDFYALVGLLAGLGVAMRLSQSRLFRRAWVGNVRVERCAV